MSQKCEECGGRRAPERHFSRRTVMQRLKKIALSTGFGLTLVAFFVLHSGLTRAEESGDESSAPGVLAAPLETATQTPAAAQGMRVYRDPQTGQLGPPPPGVQPPGLSIAEQHMLNRSDTGLQSRALPGGGVAVDLQGRYQSMAVATVGADGQAAVNCAVTPEQAEVALQAEQQAGTGSAD
jgi:hypothetical protein